MRYARNFVLRLSINYILLTILLALRGISRDRQLFGVWIVAFVFTILTVTIRRLLLTLALPLIIMTGGLFIFVVDGIVLVLTGAMTRLNVANFWWALAGVLVMSNTNIWVERAFRAIGWFREEDEDGVENILTARTPSWWLQLVLFAILLFGVVFSGAMAGQLFLLISMATQSILVMTVAACAAFVLLVAGVSWLVAEGLVLDRRARFSLAVAVVAILGIVLPVSGLIFNPAPIAALGSPQPRPETQYWDLSTGSHIAYSYFPAEGGRPRRNPIVFLHGGPGWAVLDTDIEFFKQFTQEGFDVYLYDQVGTGLSGRLSQIGEYTVWRNVEDLEAIRETIQADRLILIAHEAGCGIAARYMVDHRDRVERVVFYSPSPLWENQQFAVAQVRTAAFPARPYTLQDIRPAIAMAIAVDSPRTAQAYIPQSEMTAWFDRIVDERMMVCVGEENLAPTPQSPGYNGYAQVVGEVTADEPPDPRPGLRQLLIPTILLRGECDPIDASVVQQYQDAVAFLRVYEFPNAGSIIHLSDPEGVKAVILAFLNREDVPRS